MDVSLVASSLRRRWPRSLSGLAQQIAEGGPGPEARDSADALRRKAIGAASTAALGTSGASADRWRKIPIADLGNVRFAGGAASLCTQRAGGVATSGGVDELASTPKFLVNRQPSSCIIGGDTSMPLLPDIPDAQEPRALLDDLSQATGVGRDDVMRVVMVMAAMQAQGGGWLTDARAHGYIGLGPAVIPGVSIARGEYTSLNPVVLAIAQFQERMDRAAILLSCAFADSEVKDFKTLGRQSPIRSADPQLGWYASVVNSALTRFREVRNALVHRWTPTPEAELLYHEAFNCLVALTPAADELSRLRQLDPARASSELARLLDPIAEEIAATAKLHASLSGEGGSEAERLEAAQKAILATAGDAWSLRQAAEALEVTKQALHKRVRAGTVLGVMLGSRLALPRVQFRQHGASTRHVGGLGPIIKMFRDAGAGEWSALQFLVHLDPNLSARPIDALWARRTKAVQEAAAAYLGLGEG